MSRTAVCGTDRPVKGDYKFEAKRLCLLKLKTARLGGFLHICSILGDEHCFEPVFLLHPCSRTLGISVCVANNAASSRAIRFTQRLDSRFHGQKNAYNLSTSENHLRHIVRRCMYAVGYTSVPSRRAAYSAKSIRGFNSTENAAGFCFRSSAPNACKTLYNHPGKKRL